MWIIGAIILLAALVCVLGTLSKLDELDDLREQLDKREVQLDERANRLAADEQTITLEWQMLRKAKEELRNEKRTAQPTDDSGH